MSGLSFIVEVLYELLIFEDFYEIWWKKGSLFREWGVWVRMCQQIHNSKRNEPVSSPCGVFVTFAGNILQLIADSKRSFCEQRPLLSDGTALGRTPTSPPNFARISGCKGCSRGLIALFDAIAPYQTRKTRSRGVAAITAGQGQGRNNTNISTILCITKTLAYLQTPHALRHNPINYLP